MNYEKRNWINENFSIEIILIQTFLNKSYNWLSNKVAFALIDRNLFVQNDVGHFHG